jgi:hypothetical protein
MNKPKNPYLVLAASVFPGAGHVLLGQPQRGLMFIFFMTILGWVSFKLMPEDATFIGRHIGGIFIWGMSVIDAFRTARINQKSVVQSCTLTNPE